MLRQVLDMLDLLDDPNVDGARVADYLTQIAPGVRDNISVARAEGPKGHTDFIQVRVPGTRGRSVGGTARTLGIVGRLGGIGARPERIGYVSDGDGATAALAAAAKLLDMSTRGDTLPGDVIIGTHICPNAPTRPHEPVPFMDSPISMDQANEYELSSDMEAIVSIDTTKGNKIINHRGIAISNTTKEGYILPVSPDLVAMYETVCGIPAQVFPLSIQDITPYSNGLYHINSILQPTTATTAPVVGVALTAVTAVAGSATGASHEYDIELAARYSIEVAKGFGDGWLNFHDQTEWSHLQRLYGPLTHLQTPGEGGPATEDA
ncbi:MAG: DUF1177 domain-containing protein [Propioniciclava sp.]